MAISKISKALRLCAGQNKIEFEKHLQIYILRAKKLLWHKNKEINSNQANL